jgi:hypothetical protein
MRCSATFDAAGAFIDELIVDPGEDGSAHLFFVQPPPLAPVIDITIPWYDCEAVTPVLSDVETTLARRFVLMQGIVTELELRGAAGERPPARTPRLLIDTGLEPIAAPP